MAGIVKVIESVIQIFPDAVFWGTGFISFITLSYSYGIFFLSMIEAGTIYHGFNYLNENIRLFGTNSLQSEKCRSSFENVTLHSIKLFQYDFRPTFLSISIFMTSFIASYIVGVILYLKDELVILGGNYGEHYNSRMYGSVVMFTAIVFIIMTYRLLTGCDNPVNIVVSLLLGLSVGGLILLQNNRILGIQSLNLLGVPILRKRTETGADLYVCSPT
jgi:hypothetical protein